MAELFPDDPKLSRFASRFSNEGFDPTAVRLIVSPATQMKSKGVMQSIEQPASVQDSPRPTYTQEVSPRPQYLQINSPKRPFPVEDLENELNRPRKLQRGESPLKGAAGRRLDQQRRLQGTPGGWQSNAPPFVVPRDITFLLSIIPRADTYKESKFSADAMVRLLRETIVPDYATWEKAKEESAPPPQRYPPPPRPSSSTYQPYPVQQYSGPPGGYQVYAGQGNGMPVTGWYSSSYAPALSPGPRVYGYQRDHFSTSPGILNELPSKFAPSWPEPSKYQGVHDSGPRRKPASPPHLSRIHLVQRYPGSELTSLLIQDTTVDN